MLDLSCVKKRYMAVMFNGRRLDIEPPKLKTINRLMDIVKESQRDAVGAAEAVSQLTPIIVRLLSKNKQNFRVSMDAVEQAMDYDAMLVFLKALFGWLNEEKHDPN